MRNVIPLNIHYYFDYCSLWSWLLLMYLDNQINIIIHSFISNIYTAPLQERLLRGAPNSSAAKKNSLQTRDELAGIVPILG